MDIVNSTKPHVYEKVMWGDKLKAIKDNPTNKIKKGRVYYLRRCTLTLDDDMNEYAEIYDARGNVIGNMRTEYFKIIVPNINFKAKEFYYF